MFEQEKCAVSWHADSTLDHFSSIGVYHCTTARPLAASTSAAVTRDPAGSAAAGATGDRDTRFPPNKKQKREEGNETAGKQKEDITSSMGEVASSKELKEEEESSNGCDSDSDSDGDDSSWRIALRVWYDAEGPNAAKAVTSRAGEMATAAGARICPPVALPLPNRHAYFLLDDFNHHHQHAGKEINADPLAAAAAAAALLSCFKAEILILFLGC